jgi:hypothetical protein
MFVIVRLDRTIQYSEAPATEPRTRGVLDTRRSLSSGAHSRDPVAGMTAVRSISSTSLRGALAAKQSSPSLLYWIAPLPLAMTVLDDWLFEN